MADTTSYIEMLRKFGSDLGLPKLNVDELRRRTSTLSVRARR
jgi:hypothetical protein